MILVGRPFIVACMMPVSEAAELVGELQKADLGKTILK
jgi:hypothetical protein